MNELIKIKLEQISMADRKASILLLLDLAVLFFNLFLGLNVYSKISCIVLILGITLLMISLTADRIEDGDEMNLNEIYLQLTNTLNGKHGVMGMNLILYIVAIILSIASKW